MKFEKLNYGKEKNKRMFLYGFIVCAIFLVLLNIIISKSLYRKTESVQLAKGTVNYSLADLNIIAMYQEKDSYNSEDDKYESIDEVPKKGYEIDNERSYCKEPGSEKEIKNILSYENGKLIVDISKKGTKCYLYFEKNTYDGRDLLADLELKKSNEGCPQVNAGEVKVTGIENSKKLICSAPDNDGESYYFRGAIDNNWVKFAKTSDNEDIWWRILRINGDGTIRLIYAGKGSTAPNNNGENAIDSQAYNEEVYDNTHVGFYIQDSTTTAYPDAHQGTNPSDIAKELNTWFTTTTKLSDEIYQKHIDENAGFCNDRRKSTATHGSSSYTNKGYGTELTWYAPFDRVAQSDTASGFSKTEQKPSLKCGENDSDDYKRDYFTWSSHADKGNKILIQPIGLITMDEIILAGGFGNKENYNYWLYTNQNYWTMSPYDFSGSAMGMAVYTGGGISAYSVSNAGFGVRPVINLKAYTKFEPSNDNGEWGTKTNPYIVS